MAPAELLTGSEGAMSTATGGTSSEPTWDDYERALDRLNLAYGQLSMAQRLRANRSVISGFVVSLVIALFYWMIPPIPFRYLVRIIAELQIISSAFAQQQPQQLVPIGVHIIIAVGAFILLAIGFLWSLYTVFQNPSSTPAQRDIAKLFIGFFIGIGSRYFA
jgi:hypothetical protein